MNLKNKIIPDYEIDLKKIILRLWIEKYLIQIITITFVAKGYIYGIF